MTEKRYELKCHEINSWHIEKDGKVLIFDLFKSDAEILYTELNSLSDENEQLKKENEKYRQILLDFGVRTIFKENTVLKDGDVE